MLRIFLSKKEDDQIIAKRIREELNPLLGQDVEIVMSQDIPGGADWRGWIKKQLSTTDLLILLITDSSKPLDWCIYEVGLYEPLSERPPKPIVCLYPEGDKRPSQIEHLQGIECSKEQLSTFLKELFEGKITGEAINRVAAEDDRLIKKLSGVLHHVLTPSEITDSESVYYTRHVSILLELDESDKDAIPTESVITGDELSLEVFRLEKVQPNGNPWTWGDLRPYFGEAFREAGSDPEICLREFETLLIEACKGVRIAPLDAHIRSLTSKKKYRPVMHRRDYLDDGHFRVRVLLVQEPEPESGERNQTFAARPGE